MERLVSVERLHEAAVLVLFRDAGDRLRAWFASPKLSVLMENGELDGVEDSVLLTAGVSFSLEHRSFHLRRSLKGGGCSVSKANGYLEPIVPASSPDQAAAQSLIQKMHECQAKDDFAAALLVADEIEDLSTRELDKPFAVLRTLIEAYTSLDWTGRVCTSWIVERVKEMLDVVFLRMVLERQAISHSTKQYMRQLVDIMLKDVDKDERMDLYLHCYLKVIMSGLDVIGTPEFSEDPDLRIQVVNTLKMLRGEDTPLPSIVHHASSFYFPSLFHRALSIEVAAEVCPTDPQGLDYLLTFLQSEPDVDWSLRYLALIKLAHLLNSVEPALQRKVIEGEPPLSRGIVQLLEVTDGDTAWAVRAAAFHACVIITMESDSEEIRRMADTAADGLRNMEVDGRVRDFMRQTTTLRKLCDPKVEDYIDQPSPYLMTLLSSVGKAHLAHIPSKSPTLFEKDFLHPSARVFITKANLAIVTGGFDHPSHTYEVSLDTCEYLRMAELTEGRSNHAMSLLDNTVYVTGGRGYSAVLVSAEAYTGGTWERVDGSLRKPREGHSAVVANRKLYVVGGTGSEDVGCTIEVMENGGWTVLAARLPESRVCPAVVFTTACHMLVAGGKNQKSRKEVWQIDIATGSLQSLPKLPSSSSFPSNPVCLSNGYVYVLSCEEMALMVLDLVDLVWRVYEPGEEQ